MLANILEFIGIYAGKFGSTMCLYLFLEEEECPKSLIK